LSCRAIPDGSRHAAAGIAGAEEIVGHAVYLRFSPLIGGPRWLPLHVAVLVDTRDEASDGGERDEAEAERGGGRAAAERRGAGGGGDDDDDDALLCWDFLPAAPTEPATLARLATLRAVPGVVRERRLSRARAAHGGGGARAAAAGGGGATLWLVRVGRARGGVARWRAAAAAHPRELHLVTNNCARFAVALLREVR